MAKPKFGIICWDRFSRSEWQKTLSAIGEHILLKANIAFAENKIENLWIKKTSEYLFTNYVDESTLMGAGLRMVIVPTSGADFQHITAHSRVKVVDQGGVLAAAVAEHALALTLTLLKQLPMALEDKRSGKWVQEPYFSSVQQLSGKSVFIIGCGRVGAGIARLCAAFGAGVTGFDLYPSPKPGFTEVCHISEMMQRIGGADIIISALPLSKETEGCFSRDFFGAVKHGALFINIARGKLVDQDALVAALRSGSIAAAGLDVVRDEPLPVKDPLWEMPNVIITPHIAGNINLFSGKIMENAIEAVLDDMRQRGE